MDYSTLYTVSAEMQVAVLVAVATGRQPADKTSECLDELAFLAKTQKITSVARFTQRLRQPDRRTYVGKGKLEEIKTFLATRHVDVVICDDDLLPAQFRYLETLFAPVRVMDRTLLVLQIFESRAQSQQSRLALELARCRYFFPRLTGLWSHLSRQGGGTAGTRGPGETELETDRQLVKARIAMLREKLRRVDLQAQIRRQERGRTVRVALVGYTNVGKSSLMNVISKVSLNAEDKLFATVDTTVRRVEHWGVPFLLSDTVGFIRKLSPLLIESFKSTLDEVREADVLLLVEDISSPFCSEHLSVVCKTLQQIGAGDIPTILVFNKVDKCEEIIVRESADNHPLTIRMSGTLTTLPAGFLPKAVVYVSAIAKTNMQWLQSVLKPLIYQKYQEHYPDRPLSAQFFQDTPH